MNLSTNIKPFHLFIGIVVCAVAGIGLARLFAPSITKTQIVDDTITIGAPGKSGAGTQVNQPPQSRPTTRSEEVGTKPIPSTDQNDERVCIQMITPARNKATGEIRDFPTPCDIPEGWEPVFPITN